MGASHGWGGGKNGHLLKICHTYPTMIKHDTVIPYLKKIQKKHKSCDTSLVLCWKSLEFSIFLPEITNFYCIKKYRYRLLIKHYFWFFELFFECFKHCMKKPGTVFMISAKMVTLGILELKIFWNKVYDVITSVCNATNKILSGDSNYILNAVMWLKFRNFSISMRGVIITSIL